MKKENRILKNRDFSLVIKNGIKLNTNSLTVFYTKNQNNNFRIGITVSKKVSKLAVIRNKLKRQISSIFNELYDEAKKYDIVVVVKPNILNDDFEEIKKQISKLNNKIV